jgi:hypothetical protein
MCVLPRLCLPPTRLTPASVIVESQPLYTDFANGNDTTRHAIGFRNGGSSGARVETRQKESGGFRTGAIRGGMSWFSRFILLLLFELQSFISQKSMHKADKERAEAAESAMTALTLNVENFGQENRKLLEELSLLRGSYGRIPKKARKPSSFKYCVHF